MLTFLLICLEILDAGLPVAGTIGLHESQLRPVADMVVQRPLWYLLREGMNYEEIEAILGPPPMSELSFGFPEPYYHRWLYFGGEVEFFNGTVKRFHVYRRRMSRPLGSMGPEAKETISALEGWRKLPEIDLYEPSVGCEEQPAIQAITNSPSPRPNALRRLAEQQESR